MRHGPDTKLEYGIRITQERRFRFVVRQRWRYIGTRRTFPAALRLAQSVFEDGE